MSTMSLPIRIKEELLRFVPKNLIVTRLQYLAKLFKEEYTKLFGLDIDSENKLLFLLHLSTALERLENTQGFVKHVKEFGNSVTSTYFVTTLASYLLQRGYVVELESQDSNEETNKVPDIKIDIDNTCLYIECKSPRKQILDILDEKEHDKMYDILKENITKPCDVFISYDRDLTEIEIHRLGEFLRDTLPTVKSEGTILDKDGIKVEVTNVRDSFIDIGEVLLQLPVDNNMSPGRNPATIINRNGITIGFIRTNFYNLRNLEQQIKASLRKVPSDRAIIVAIEAEHLSGNLEENVRQISKFFQPAKFTSINGIVLVRWTYNFQHLVHIQFQYINNPFAKNPISDIHRLFRPA